MTDPLITSYQAAKIIGISRQAVDQAIQRGDLPAERKRITVTRIRQSEAEKFKSERDQSDA